MNIGKYIFPSIVVTGVVALVMTGCSLIDVNQETVEISVSSTEEEINESYAMVQKMASLPHPEGLYTIDTVYIDEVLPVDSEFEDGYYTVSLTPNDGVNDNGCICEFYPWTQLEVNRDFIDSLEEGQVLELSGWGRYSTVTVNSITTIVEEPYSYLGTNYSGEAVVLKTDKGPINILKVDGIDIWKVFESSHEPMIMYCNPVSIGVAADCVIYDAYSFVSSLDYDNSETSQIDFRAVRDLTDMESTKGVTGSIRDFFDKWHFDRYDLTVIKIENNMITEVYIYF